MPKKTVGEPNNNLLSATRRIAHHLRPFVTSLSTTGMSIAHSVEGHVGSVTLNRPKKLNALDMEMVRQLRDVYDGWVLAADSPVKCIVLDGAGGKAFCAGGDMASVQIASIAGESLPQDFFFEEYQLNNIIATMFERQGIPQIALWDGITMGGGVGLSVHGRFRVATEKTLWAMPETGIGLFPDVGGTYMLSRVTGGLPVGLYIGLTGARLGAADCIDSGLATHYIPQSRLGLLHQELVAMGEGAADDTKIESILDALRAGEEPSTDKALLKPNADAIQRCFSGSTAEEIVSNLESEPGEWAAKTLIDLKRMSPTSIKVTMEACALHAGSECTISDALSMEYRISQRCMRPQPHSDFYEGIRAVLIDKDQEPVWDPAAFEKVGLAAVTAYFAPLETTHPRGELAL
jgi:enoyl-CoA hydratase/carnithine racemase